MRYTLPIAAVLVRKASWVTRVTAIKIHEYVAKRVPVCEMLAIFVVDSFDPEVEYMCAMAEALYSPEVDFTDQLVAEALEDASTPSDDLSD